MTKRAGKTKVGGKEEDNTGSSPAETTVKSRHIYIKTTLSSYVTSCFHDIRLLRILQKAKTVMIQWTLCIWNKGFAQTVPCIIMITIKKTRIIKHDIMNRDGLAT